jgi:uncharacterized protein with von Willebrand factor type A (vWA) domain
MDLRQLLDDKLTGAPAPAGDLDAAAPEAASPTVLQVDRWGRRRGRELAEEWKAEQGSTLANASEHTVADALTSLFDPKPQPAARPEDQERAKWWQQLMETPEYRALHSHTQLSPSLSRLGAAELVNKWVQYRIDQMAQDAVDRHEDKGDGEEGDDIGQEIARIRSTAAAAKSALEEVRTAEATAAGLGLGDAAQLDTKQVAQHMQAIRGSTMLRRIMEMAGRYIARARTLQRERLDAHRGDITGIELAGDIGRLLPFELMQVAGAVPELEALALYRLATRRTLAYKHSKREPVGLGPIVVTVDESGSMRKDGRIEMAKGLALAMAWIARQQKRPFMLVSFASGSKVYATAASPSPENVIDWCSHFFNGGTSLDGPLGTVPQVSWKALPANTQGRADHIIITDGEMDCHSHLRNEYLRWVKAQNVRTFGLIIASRSPGGLAEVADRFWCVPDLSLGQAAIESLLSIGD